MPMLLLFSGCKAEEDDSSAAVLAAAALANVDVNCGAIDLGTTQLAPGNSPSGTESPVSFSPSADGSKYLAVVLLQNAPAGRVVVVKTGVVAGAFAFADAACPIDQGTNNGDALANSIVLRTANSTQTTFTIQTAGSYALVVTATSDPGQSVTMQITN